MTACVAPRRGARASRIPAAKFQPRVQRHARDHRATVRAAQSPSRSRNTPFRAQHAACAATACPSAPASRAEHARPPMFPVGSSSPRPRASSPLRTLWDGGVAVGVNSSCFREGLIGPRLTLPQVPPRERRLVAFAAVGPAALEPLPPSIARPAGSCVTPHPPPGSPLRLPAAAAARSLPPPPPARPPAGGPPSPRARAIDRPRASRGGSRSARAASRSPARASAGTEPPRPCPRPACSATPRPGGQRPRERPPESGHQEAPAEWQPSVDKFKRRMGKATSKKLKQELRKQREKKKERTRKPPPSQGSTSRARGTGLDATPRTPPTERDVGDALRDQDRAAACDVGASRRRGRRLAMRLLVGDFELISPTSTRLLGRLLEAPAGAAFVAPPSSTSPRPPRCAAPLASPRRRPSRVQSAMAAQ